MKKTALLLIDLQNDFMEGGALAVPNGSDVIPIANRLMPQFPLVIATQDWHPANHQSFASQHQGIELYSQFDLHGLPQTAWPDHCVQDTFGAELGPGLDLSMIHERVMKGTDPSIDSYSGFFDNGHRRGTGLTELLRKHAIAEVTIMGLATDYCVLYSALDAIREGFATTVLIDGCRGVGLAKTDIDRAWNTMRRAGVRCIASERVLFPRS